MKKLLLGSIILTAFSASLLVFQMSSCTKTKAETGTVCDVKGFYSGTNVASTGVSSVLTYDLRENNFAVGGSTPGSGAVTFGGYRNTCDSVIMSVYYTGNESYYLLQGKLSNNKNTISGTFKNLTTPSDFGTFSISK